jgi:lysozyme
MAGDFHPFVTIVNRHRPPRAGFFHVEENAMSNPITYRTAIEVASHEAIVRQAYKDSVGVWTWSVGLTSATGHDVTRYIGKPQTMQRCLEVYVWALDKYADRVRKAFAGYPLSEAQFAAALSFEWNTGSIGKASWVRLWKEGKIAAAKSAFMDWSKPAEIVPRRQKERDLFFDGKWSNNGTVTEYTRVSANGTPVWGSAKKVNIEADLKAALGASDAPSPPPEPAPQPTRTRATVRAEINALLDEYERLEA